MCKVFYAPIDNSPIMVVSKPECSPTSNVSFHMELQAPSPRLRRTRRSARPSFPAPPIPLTNIPLTLSPHDSVPP
jgi:hypothetical protein